MVTRDNTPKILDFGLAKLAPTLAKGTSPRRHRLRGLLSSAPPTLGAMRLPGESDASRCPGSASVMCTWENMSPEQVTGHEVDHRRDIFSFGVTMYRGLTEQQLFTGFDERSLAQTIIHGRPIPVRLSCPDASATLEQVTERTLAKSIDDRYRTTEDFARALLDSLGHPGRRRSWQIAGVMACVLVIVAAYLMLFTCDKATPIAVLPFEDTGAGVFNYIGAIFLQDIHTILSVFHNIQVLSDMAVRAT
jgi:serine/threonine protein kinase